MTEINLASGEAANFIFKLPNNTAVNGDIYMSMLAVPELETLEMANESTYIYGGRSNTKLACVVDSHSLTMGLNLRAVPHVDNSLCHLTKK